MTAVTGVDSWWEPDSAQIAAAKAAGYGAWLGYISNGSYAHPDGIYHGWADATFQAIQAAGLLTAAYCSSRDDAAWVKAKAASLGIRAILDCEPSVMSNWADAAAQDAWLNVSGTAVYGSGPRYGATNVMNQHLGHGHPGLVLADYSLGDEGTTWPVRDSRPSGSLTGWQYAGGVDFAGGQVDIGHYDLALLQLHAPQPIPIEENNDMAGYIASWKWPEKDATTQSGGRQQNTACTTGDGRVVYSWFDGAKWDDEVSLKDPQGNVLTTVIPGTLAPAQNTQGQVHLWALTTDGNEAHWWQGVNDADWSCQYVASGLVPPLPTQATGGGLTAAQAQQLNDVQAKLAAIEAALKGA